jgi:outer membrane protein assembly factor BamB
MTTNHAAVPIPGKPLRLWPGVLLAVLLLLVRFGVPAVLPEMAMLGIIGWIAGGLAIAVWWLFLSRAPWSERIGVLALMMLALYATSSVVHESIANGMMGMMLPIVGFPALSLALVVSVAATNRLARTVRRASVAAAVLLACCLFALLRTDGINGAGQSDLHWRWTPSPEERLLADAIREPLALAPAPPSATNVAPPSTSGSAVKPASVAGAEAAAKPAEPKADDESPAPPADLAAAGKISEWPGFRGPDRDSIVRGSRLGTDWSTSPPVELWRRPVGPGWSSFAVSGDLFYTQEQRGSDEMVSCYRTSTGEPVWRHSDPVRFWESNGGAGPRATPTLRDGRVYAFGATGILNALDARSGAVVWSRNVAADTETEVPGWGFASSPLVIDDVVVVAADATLVAYDAATGDRRWTGPVHRGSYSSPHPTTIAGIPQILLLGGGGVVSVAPATGAVLWEHDRPGGAIVQPALMPDGSVLTNALAATGGAGTQRLAVTHGPGGWHVEERWTSNALKPYFNDFVVHNGHAFGFDGSILASIDLEDGRRTWKGGRYGNGQLVLLPDQDLLLVLSEEGELALVSATPDQFREIARFRALEGKTWNHPALIDDLLLVRNGEEMAAFRLPLADH